MACRDAVSPWAAESHQHLPHLSRSEAFVLALWSYGMVLARSCARTAVSGMLAAALGQSANTVRQRLREGCYAAAAKRGAPHRRDLTVTQGRAIRDAAAPSRAAAARSPARCWPAGRNRTRSAG